MPTMPKINSNTMYTVHQVADMYAVSPALVRKLMHSCMSFKDQVWDMPGQYRIVGDGAQVRYIPGGKTHYLEGEQVLMLSRELTWRHNRNVRRSGRCKTTKIAG